MRKFVVYLLMMIAMPIYFTGAHTNAYSQERDFSKETARKPQPWVRDAIIYQIFPRQYSAKG